MTLFRNRKQISSPLNSLDVAYRYFKKASVCVLVAWSVWQTAHSLIIAERAERSLAIYAILDSFMDAKRIINKCDNYLVLHA